MEQQGEEENKQLFANAINNKVGNKQERKMVLKWNKFIF